MAETLPEVNGSSNMPTHLVSLWINNEEGTYREMQRMIKRADDANELAEMIERFTRDNMIPELDGFASDMMEWALAYVRFDDIAASEWEDAGRNNVAAGVCEDDD